MIDWLCDILGLTWSASASWAPIVVAGAVFIVIIAAIFVFLFITSIFRRLTRFGYKYTK